MVISVNKLKIGTDFLQKEFYARKPHPEDSLESKVLLRYSQRVLNQLMAIFNESQTNSALITQLELFLEDNWQLIKGTSLCYTALPHHEVTALLSGIANYIVQEKNSGKTNTDNPAASVKILMPTVCTESMSDDYPSLEPTFDGNEGQWIDVDLAKVLQTHILSSNGLSLFPVALFGKLDTDIDSQRLFNPYFDERTHTADTVYLNSDEYERLIEHSPLTKAIVEAKTYYETFLADNNNLLGHLRQLCKKLVFNSVQVAGIELEASGGAYSAILEFNAYYNTIGNEKDKIPRALRLKIENLPRFILDPVFNLDSTKSGETCVVSIRRDLVNAIIGHEQDLSAIAVQGVNKSTLLSQAEEQFNSSKRALIEAINQEDYVEGVDKLGLTVPLLMNFGIKFLISSERDLNTLQQLSPAAITNFFQDRKLQQQLVRQLGSIEHALSFFMGMTPSQLKALLSLASPEFSQSMLKSPRDLLALFTGLDTVRCQLVCDAFKSSFQRIVTSVDSATRILRYLEPDQASLFGQTLLEIFGKKVSQLVRSAEDFSNLLQYLRPKQREVIFAALVYKAPQLIQSTSDFKAFIQYLNPQQRTEVYKLMKNSLPEMIKGSWDVSNVLQYLDAEQREESFNGFLKSWIAQHFSLSDAHYFIKEVLKYCDEAQCKIICESLRGTLTSIDHFLRVFDSLEAEKKTIFYAALREELPKLMKSAADLRSIFPYLTPLDCKLVLQSCQANKEQFPNWSFSNLLLGLDHYSKAHRDVVYEVLIPYLPQSGKQVYSLLTYFSHQHGDTLKAQLTTRLPWIIKSGLDFKETLEYLSESQRDFIYELLKDHLPQIMHSIDDLTAVLAHLSPVQRTSVCLSIKAQFPRILLSTQSLVNLLWILPLDGRNVVYEAITGKIVSQDINDSFLLKIEGARLNLQPVTHLFGAQDYAEKQRKLNAPKMKFELALVNANHQEINTEFNTLVRQAGRHRSHFFSGGMTRSCVELIVGIAKIPNKQHLKTLRDALSLRLQDKELNSPQVIEKALFQYIKHIKTDQHSGKLTAKPPMDVSL